MTKLMVRLQNNIAADREERGAAMAEYGLLLALVGLVVMGVLATFGDRLNELFGFARDTFNNSPAYTNNTPATPTTPTTP